MTQGYRLYDAIFFPHTPLLILGTAAAGELAGFSATVLRAVAGLSSGLTAALLVAAVRTPRTRLAVLLLGVPLLALQGVYFEGPALWPEPFLAPFPLAAVLLLERWERRGRLRDLAFGALVLGLGVLVKQTFAWFGLAALLWLVLGSRRRSRRAAALLAAGVATPYLAFALLWGSPSGRRRTSGGPSSTSSSGTTRARSPPFRTSPSRTRRWPRTSRSSPSGCCAQRSPRIASAPRSCRSPSPRSAWPGRAGGSCTWRRRRGSSSWRRCWACASCRSSPAASPGAASRGGAGASPRSAGVSPWRARPSPSSARGRSSSNAVGGPTRFWDDDRTREWAARARARTRPGEPLFVYEVPHETLYPLTGTVTPGGFYVNPSFWYCLNKDDLDERLVSSLRGRSDVPILFREPPEGRDGDVLRSTKTYRFLVEETEVVERIDSRAAWRKGR